MMRNMASTHKIGWFLFSQNLFPSFFSCLAFFCSTVGAPEIYMVQSVGGRPMHCDRAHARTHARIHTLQPHVEFNIVEPIVVDLMIKLVLSYCCAGHVHRRCQYPILIEVDNDLLDFLVHQLIVGRTEKKTHVNKQWEACQFCTEVESHRFFFSLFFFYF